jgi:DNA polymerase delta subunit 4
LDTFNPGASTTHLCARFNIAPIWNGNKFDHHITSHHITSHHIMAPKRRASERTTSASQQSTLSFNGKNTKRVTKPSHQSLQNGKALGAEKKEILLDEALSRASSTHPEDVTDEPKATATNKAAKQPSDAEEETLTGGSKVEDVLGGRAQTSDVGAVGGPVGSGWVSDEEARARKMSEAQIKKFWREQESLRLVPRVHQEDLDVHERVLRLWDVSGQYGVSDICWRLF